MRSSPFTSDAFCSKHGMGASIMFTNSTILPNTSRVFSFECLAEFIEENIGQVEFQVETVKDE